MPVNVNSPGRVRTENGKKTTAEVRDIRFNPAAPESSAIEVTTVERIRRRGGSREFAAPQRLDFEMLIVVSSGSAAHEVDFTRYTLTAGDALWVHAGQMQLWGGVGDIEGTVIMFSPDALPPDTVALLRSLGTTTRNHWPQVAGAGGAFTRMLAALVAAMSRRTAPADTRARDHVATHAMIALLLLLDVERLGASASGAEPPEAFGWLLDEIERSFDSERAVQWYARRLGYSERTLNRLAKANAGTTVKDLIDQRVILEAKRLLVHETTPVAAIAARLGFDDPANFSKYFQHRVGISPGRFRERFRS